MYNFMLEKKTKNVLMEYFLQMKFKKSNKKLKFRFR